MNMKMIINELNRKLMSINNFKKATFITDDYKLINTLKQAIELGINQLDQKIIKSKYVYIINSIEYLKILSLIYPDKWIELELFLTKAKQSVETILNSKQMQKNIEYNSFIQDIVNKMNEFLEYIEKQKKGINFQENIDSMLKSLEGLNDEILKKVIDNYIQNLLSIKDVQLTAYEVKSVLISLQRKKAESTNKNDITRRFLRILEEHYKLLYLMVEDEYKKQFSEYINRNYRAETEIYNPWIVTDIVEEPQPFIITIDDRGCVQIDDAIAVTRNQYGMTLHIYVANTTPFLLNNPNYESVAFERYSSINIRKSKHKKLYYMLPKECANQLSLKENEVRNVIDHAFYMDHSGNVSYKFSYRNIVINKRLTYKQVDEIMEKPKEEEKYLKRYLNSLERCIREIYLRLGLANIYNIKEVEEEKEEKVEKGKGYKIIFKTAFLVNYINAQEAMKNNYLLLYQDYYNGRYSISAPENPYAKVTSPIRRYSDLKNNYLLYRYSKNDLTDMEYYQLEQELQEMIPQLEENKERNKIFMK